MGYVDRTEGRRVAGVVDEGTSATQAGVAAVPHRGLGGVIGMGEPVPVLQDADQQVSLEDK